MSEREFGQSQEIQRKPLMPRIKGYFDRLENKPLMLARNDGESNNYDAEAVSLIDQSFQLIKDYAFIEKPENKDPRYFLRPRKGFAYNDADQYDSHSPRFYEVGFVDFDGVDHGRIKFSADQAYSHDRLFTFDLDSQGFKLNIIYISSREYYNSKDKIDRIKSIDAQFVLYFLADFVQRYIEVDTDSRIEVPEDLMKKHFILASSNRGGPMSDGKNIGLLDNEDPTIRRAREDEERYEKIDLSQNIPWDERSREDKIRWIARDLKDNHQMFDTGFGIKYHRITDDDIKKAGDEFEEKEKYIQEMLDSYKNSEEIEIKQNYPIVMIPGKNSDKYFEVDLSTVAFLLGLKEEDYFDMIGVKKAAFESSVRDINLVSYKKIANNLRKIIVLVGDLIGQNKSGQRLYERIHTFAPNYNNNQDDEDRKTRMYKDERGFIVTELVDDEGRLT